MVPSAAPKQNEKYLDYAASIIFGLLTGATSTAVTLWFTFIDPPTYMFEENWENPALYITLAAAVGIATAISTTLAHIMYDVRKK